MKMKVTVGAILALSFTVELLLLFGLAWLGEVTLADGQRKSTRSQDRSRHRLNTFKLSQGYGRCSTSVS